MARLTDFHRQQERSVDAAWGSHGPRFLPARHDAASSMGRRRRSTLGNWRLEGTPTNRDKARRRRKGEGWPRRSQRVGGVVVAGLAWAAARRRCRCSRWRPAPVRLLLGHVRRLPHPAPRVLVTPRRRRAGGGAAHRPSPPLLLFFYLPPFLFPFGGAALERGQNPNVGWWRWTTAPCPPPLAFEPPAPQGMAKTQRCPCWVCPGARGGAARFLSTHPRSQGRGAGVNGTFPPPAWLDSRARARALGVRAGWATRPCPAPRAGVARPAAR
jgi:hypothetical protein